MPRAKGARATGPYQNGSGWRIKIYECGDGDVADWRYEQVESQEAGREKVALYNASVATLARSLEVAIEEYLMFLKMKGHKNTPLSKVGLATARYYLNGLLRMKELGDRELVTITPAVAAKLYARRVTEVKEDTHHGELMRTKAAFGFMVSKGWLRANPWADIQPEGKKKKHKAPLRVDSSRAFVMEALASGEPGELAAVIALWVGARASEVCFLLREDVDANGTLLWIAPNEWRGLKSEDSDRWTEIPAELREPIAVVCAGKRPKDRLFPGLDRWKLRKIVKRICTRAGVNVTSTQGLRRTFATLSRKGGASVAAVSAALGHSLKDGGKTARGNYISQGADRSAEGARMSELLGQGSGSGSDVETIVSSSVPIPKTSDHTVN